MAGWREKYQAGRDRNSASFLLRSWLGKVWLWLVSPPSLSLTHKHTDTCTHIFQNLPRDLALNFYYEDQFEISV